MVDNMVSTGSIVRNSPGVVVKFGAILMLPWIWAVFVIPLWASAVCAGLWTVGVFAMIRLFVAPMFARQRAGDNLLSSDQIMKMRAPSPGPGAIVLDQDTRGDLGSLHNGLRRWQESSSVSSGETASARERVSEVISETESAVLALTMSFRGITTKARQQMEAAMSLLKRNAEQVNISPGTWLSLPDYIRAYEVQLQEVIESMVKFTSTSGEMLQHQTKIREQSVLIDELLDELRTMAIRIGRLALDSAVAAGESGKYGNHLIGLSDSIRETSNQAFGLTRSIRQSLETIRDELVVTYKVINKTSALAKESAQRAKADVAQLNVTMIAKTKEVEESLSKINSLGEAIQQDVNNAFIAMQFQDITQQKLEHMRGNILTEVMCNLDTLSVETQEMMKKKIFLAAQAGNEREIASADATAIEPSGASDSDAMAALDAEIHAVLEAPDRVPTVNKEVEFF
jgi:methyl-accepting chemotaxis protein